jgi:hypothetical protein
MVTFGTTIEDLKAENEVNFVGKEYYEVCGILSDNIKSVLNKQFSNVKWLEDSRDGEGISIRFQFDSRTKPKKSELSVPYLQVLEIETYSSTYNAEHVK